jgi:4-amino-4-deoxy-L-arabinose transferase-like glycosyltransferase
LKQKPSETGIYKGFKDFVSNHLILLIACVSFTINLIVLIDYQKSPFSKFLLWDAASYWKWALEIAKGNWTGDSIFHQAPLYPYLLSVFIKVFNQNLIPLYLFQSVLSAASSALICSTSIKLTDNKRTGILTGLLYSFYGLQIFYTTKILTECTAIFIIVLFVRLLISSKLLNSTLFSGITLGLLLLLKPQFLIVVPFIILYFYIRFRQTGLKYVLKKCAYFLVPLALIISFVTARNYYVGREFVLISSNGGENFYIGNHDKATGTYVPVEGISSDIAYQNADIVDAAQAASERKLTRSEVSKYWFDRGVSFIVSNPSKYISLEWTKLKDIFSGEELVNMYIMEFEKKNLTRSLNLGFINFYALFPLFCVGLIAALRFWNKYYLVIIMIFANFLNMMIFFCDSRFMLVTMPFFILLSATGLSKVIDTFFKLKDFKKAVLHRSSIVLYAGLILLLSIYIRDKKFPSQEWYMWMTLGEVYYGLDQFQKSLELFIKSSEMNKNSCMPVFGVCKSIYKIGNKELAAQVYNSTFEKIPPDDKKTILRDDELNPVREYIAEKGN